MHKEKYRSKNKENNVLLKIISKKKKEVLLIVGLEYAPAHLENRIYI